MCVWGADRLALKTMYVMSIRSVIDYGSIVYGSAAKTHVDKLERIQAKAFRICCGAYPSSSVSALQVEVGDMPLKLKGTFHAFKSFIFTYKSYICGLYKT